MIYVKWNTDALINQFNTLIDQMNSIRKELEKRGIQTIIISNEPSGYGIDQRTEEAKQNRAFNNWLKKDGDVFSEGCGGPYKVYLREKCEYLRYPTKDNLKSYFLKEIYPYNKQWD